MAPPRTRPWEARKTDRARIAAPLVDALSLLLNAGAVVAPPPAPMRLDGRALTEGGLPLGIGTPISAIIDGVVYSNLSEVYDVQGAYALQVFGNFMLGAGSPETPEKKEGADFGEEVLFAAGDFTTPTRVFQETLVWFPGAVRSLDLHLGSAPTTPAPIKIQSLVPLPAQGGNQYVSVCNPTSSPVDPVDLTDYYLEVNEPGVYKGPRVNLTGFLAAGQALRVDLPSASFLNPTGDALKLVYANPGGPQASAVGRDITVDRVEYNATVGGTLSWEPGNTILGDAPAPRPGHILERALFCGDTNSPSDFRIAQEPGLPANGPPIVSVVAPAPGVTLRAAQPFTIRWTMEDDVFLTSYLVVWVNVSYAATNASILSGVAGATSASWIVPDVEATNAVVTVTVEDPFGEREVATSGPFTITRTLPVTELALIVAGLVILVILAFLALAYVTSRRRKKGPPPQVVPPPSGPLQAPPTAPLPPHAAEGPTEEGRKTCPRCGTAVYERDWTCFYCGYRFPGLP